MSVEGLHQKDGEQQTRQGYEGRVHSRGEEDWTAVSGSGKEVLKNRVHEIAQ